MKERFKATPAVYLILENNNKVLLMRRFQTGYEDGNYTVPAGHVEEGESPKQCMVREALEKVGLKVNEKDVEFSSVLYRAKADETGERIDFFFKANKWDGEPINCEPHKCDHLDWFDLDNLPDNMIPHILEAINLYKENINYMEIGW